MNLCSINYWQRLFQSEHNLPLPKTKHMSTDGFIKSWFTAYKQDLSLALNLPTIFPYPKFFQPVLRGLNDELPRKKERRKASHKQAHDPADKKQVRVFDHSPSCFDKCSREQERGKGKGSRRNVRIAGLFQGPGPGAFRNITFLNRARLDAAIFLFTESELNKRVEFKKKKKRRKTPGEENVRVKWELGDSLRLNMHATWNWKAHLNSKSFWMLSATCTTPESLGQQAWNGWWKAEKTSPCSHNYTVHCACPTPLGKNWCLVMVFTAQVSPDRSLAQRLRTLHQGSRRDWQAFL